MMIDVTATRGQVRADSDVIIYHVAKQEQALELGGRRLKSLNCFDNRAKVYRDKSLVSRKLI